MRRILSMIALSALVITSCGDDGGGFPTDASSDLGSNTDIGSVQARTADIDPCALLTDAELTSVLGTVPPSRSFGPNGPFTGCSWGTGDLSVSIAGTDKLILAPGERERCEAGDLGEDSLICAGEVTFLLNGIQVGVSTIGDTTIEQMLTLARTIPAKLPG